MVTEAIALLQAQRGPTEATQPVFRSAPAPALGEALDTARSTRGLKGLRPHDLGRTLAMRMAERGGPDVLATIGAILGQKPPYWTTLIFF